jgi:drug efflux transport system permease protein
MRRLRALMRKEFTHMRHDPRTFMVIFIMPILQLVLLGYATNTDVKNVPTAIFDQDNTTSSRKLLDAYQSTGFFSLDYFVTSENELNRLIQGGQAKVGIAIPPNYSSDLAAGHTVNVAVLIDGSDPTVAQTALSTATLVGQSQGSAIRIQDLAMRGPAVASALPLDTRTMVLYNPDLLSTYNMIPALIAMILMMTTTNLTSAAIVKERERGTIEQLIVTPIRSWELVIAKITPYVFVSMLNVLVILLVGTFWFHVPIQGSVLLLLALTGLYLLPNLGLGLLISTFAKSQQQAQFMVMPIMLPSMMLSGFFFPVAALPAVLQFVSSLLPVTYFMIIVRSIVVKGAGLDLLIRPSIALGIFSVVLVGIAALRFRKSLD